MLISKSSIAAIGVCREGSTNRQLRKGAVFHILNRLKRETQLGIKLDIDDLGDPHVDQLVLVVGGSILSFLSQRSRICSKAFFVSSSQSHASESVTRSSR